MSHARLDSPIGSHDADRLQKGTRLSFGDQVVLRPVMCDGRGDTLIRLLLGFYRLAVAGTELRIRIGRKQICLPVGLRENLIQARKALFQSEVLVDLLRSRPSGPLQLESVLQLNRADREPRGRAISGSGCVHLGSTQHEFDESLPPHGSFQGLG